MNRPLFHYWIKHRVLINHKPKFAYFFCDDYGLTKDGKIVRKTDIYSFSKKSQ